MAVVSSRYKVGTKNANCIQIIVSDCLCSSMDSQHMNCMPLTLVKEYFFNLEQIIQVNL